MHRTSHLAVCTTILLLLATSPGMLHADTGKGIVKVYPLAKVMTTDPGGGVRPKGLAGNGGTSRANDPHDLPCEGDEIFVIYDEDANGNPVPGTEVYGCTDP